MAIVVYTFENSVHLPHPPLADTAWEWALVIHKHTEDSWPANKTEDISSDVSHGPRRSILITRVSPLDQEDVIGTVEVFHRPNITPGIRREAEAEGKEIFVESAQIDALHQFYPIYQTGEGDEVDLCRLVRYVPRDYIRVEDLREAEVYA